MSALDAFADYLVSTVGQWGLVGIFVLMAVESSFIPFPSEVVMIPAGYLASRGEMNLGAAILAGTLGSIAGAWFNYWIALRLGRPAVHRLAGRFFVPERTLVLVESYFDKHGEFTTFVGRLLPAVRQLISLPAGLARMNFARFTLFTTLGAGIWVTVLALLGYYIGEQAERTGDALRGLTIGAIVVVAALVVLYALGRRYFTRQVHEA